MSMPRQHKIILPGRDSFKQIRVMHQYNLPGPFRNTAGRPVDPGPAGPEVIESYHVERGSFHINTGMLVYQHPYPMAAELSGELRGIYPVVMVPRHRENPIQAFQFSQRFCAGRNKPCRDTYKIACDKNEIRLQVIHHPDTFPDILEAHHGAVMNIAYMDEGEPMQPGRQVLEAEGDPGDFRAIGGNIAGMVASRPGQAGEAGKKTEKLAARQTFPEIPVFHVSLHVPVKGMCAYISIIRRKTAAGNTWLIEEVKKGRWLPRRQFLFHGEMVHHRKRHAMKIIGLIGSARKLGNTEILVKEALLGARAPEVSVDLIRLTDLSIKSCNGCMSCIFQGAPCPLQDDMAFLLDALVSADCLVVGAPTYVLGPAGVIKMLTDRLFMMATAREPGLRGRKAGTIATAGIRNWEPFALPLLNILPLSLGYRLFDSFIAHAPGPGEVLLEEGLLTRARRLGKLLISDMEPPEERETLEATCPVCRGTAFIIRSSGEIECSCCSLVGSIADRDGRPSFVPHPGGSHRWTESAMRAHVDGWIKLTEGRFKDHMREILKRRKAYRETPFQWLRAPGKMAPGDPPGPGRIFSVPAQNQM